MKTTSEHRLADTACKIAMESAATYIHALKLTVDVDDLCEALKVEMKKDIFTALADAKAALDANMGQIAEATFKASMKLTGINAVKKVA